MKIFVLGASGMAGQGLFKFLQKKNKYEIYGSTRNNTNEKNIISNVDAYDTKKIETIIKDLKINCVINCIGLIKQKQHSNLEYININSVFPHKLARICEKNKTRIIHLSTDCVFDGSKGDYKEEDEITAKDMYGQTKYCGELSYDHTITIRTSIIGKEAFTKNSLVEWFLSQNKPVKGFKNAIFSGFSVFALSNIIDDYLLQNESIFGVYHLSSNPINKYDLLLLIAKYFKKNTPIEPDYDFFCDRSLNCDKFKSKTNFKSENWELMIKEMHDNWDI